MRQRASSLAYTKFILHGAASAPCRTGWIHAVLLGRILSFFIAICNGWRQLRPILNCILTFYFNLITHLHELTPLISYVYDVWLSIFVQGDQNSFPVPPIIAVRWYPRYVWVIRGIKTCYIPNYGTIVFTCHSKVCGDLRRQDGYRQV